MEKVWKCSSDGRTSLPTCTLARAYQSLDAPSSYTCRHVISSRQATERSCFVHTTQQIYEEDNKSALERLGRHGTFKSRALWSVREGKRLIINKMCLWKSWESPTKPRWILLTATLSTCGLLIGLFLFQLNSGAHHWTK